MTTHFATQLMPAGITSTSIPIQDRKEVKTVALLDIMLFDLFRDAERVSSQADAEKALRLELVRRRRRHDEVKAAQLNALYGFRR